MHFVVAQLSRPVCVGTCWARETIATPPDQRVKAKLVWEGNGGVHTRVNWPQHAEFSKSAPCSRRQFFPFSSVLAQARSKSGGDGGGGGSQRRSRQISPPAAS